jgi:hypothetical protein
MCTSSRSFGEGVAAQLMIRALWAFLDERRAQDIPGPLFFFNQKEKRCNEAVEEGEEPDIRASAQAFL